MTYIIAEAGTNHAHPNYAERIHRVGDLIRAASRAGVNAVKFQAFFPDEPLFCPFPGDEHRWPRWKESYLTEVDWEEASELAKTLGIDLLLSVFQPRGVELLKRMKPCYIKVASRAAEKFPYDEFPEGNFLVSTGMGFKLVTRGPEASLAWLQCAMKYPVPLAEARWLGNIDGLSDHSGTVWPGLDAIFRGAKFLEVHFNLGDYDAGPDKPVCLTVDQLKLLCEARDAAAAMRQD